MGLWNPILIETTQVASCARSYADACTTPEEEKVAGNDMDHLLFRHVASPSFA